MSTEPPVNTSAPDLSWAALDLPGSQVTIMEDGQVKEERLIRFYEDFSTALDLTAPENIIEQPQV